MYLIAPDGSKEIVSFGDKYWDGFPGRPAMVGRPLSNGKWSHGPTKPGYRIEEIEKS